MRRPQLKMFQARKHHIPRKIHLIRERLIRRQKPQIFSRVIWGRVASSIEPVLEDNGDTMSCDGHFVQKTFLEEGETACAVRFPGLEDDDGAVGFVVGCVEPVAEGKGAIEMRFVERVVVEVVDGDGEVVGGVQEGWVGVIAFEEVGGDGGFLVNVRTG